MPRCKPLILMPSLPMNSGRLSKQQKRCLAEEVEAGDCWIAVSLAQLSGLILSGRIGKHTDQLAVELVINTQGKTDGTEWHTDGWGGYERVLRDDEIEHYIRAVGK